MAAKVLLAVTALLLVMPTALSALAPTEHATSRIGAPVDQQLKTSDNKKKKHPYISPTGLFIQERASKQLPGPGQHFSFGALVPWEEIHQKYVKNGRKLLLVVRHGQAVSNYLGDTLGPDEWYKLEQTCSYTDPDNTTWGIFDADLTTLGQDQAGALNSQLGPAGWFATLSGKRPAMAVVSPLSRCLETAALVTNGLNLTRTKVEEYVRETLGEDTCDARRSVSDPEPDPEARAQPAKVPAVAQQKATTTAAAAAKDAAKEQPKGAGGRRSMLHKHHHKHEHDGDSDDEDDNQDDSAFAVEMEEHHHGKHHKHHEEREQEQAGEQAADGEEEAVGRHGHHKPSEACSFEHGLRSKFPQFEFEVLGEDKTRLGLLSDEDTLWGPDFREKQKDQVKRAKKFLDALFEEVKEEVVLVVTHSGFTRSLLLAVGREPYRPVNAELVPVIVEKTEEKKRKGEKSKKEQQGKKDQQKHQKEKKHG